MERKHSEHKVAAAAEERRHGNPAHLIRQARKSKVGEDDMARVVGHRHRRWSAPVNGDYANVLTDSATSSCDGGPLQAKAFRTKAKAAIRTLPSAVSLKIGDLPQGWKVAEAQKEAPAGGWIAIEPRGYVLAEELVPASPLRRGEPLQPEAALRASRHSSMNCSFELAAREVATHEAVASRSSRRTEAAVATPNLPKEPWRYGGACRRTETPLLGAEAPAPKSARGSRRKETPVKQTLSRSISAKGPVAQSPRLVPPSSPSRTTGAMSPSKAPRSAMSPSKAPRASVRQSNDVEAF
jgi:hypothetical protein